MMPPLEISATPCPVHEVPTPRERPILFSAPMVRALLAGTKTQTRRVVALPRSRESFVLEDYGDGWWPYQSDDGESSVCSDGMEHPYASPYGLPGDRLWVRETFALEQSVECDQEPPHHDERPVRRRPQDDFECVHPAWVQAHYRATDPAPDLCYEQGPAGGSEHDFGVRWRPCIHMPRWASRILLEVSGVRVERLQDISEADAIAEGIEPGAIDGRWRIYGRETDGSDMDLSPRVSYRSLWESINGAGSWDANPWVWVVEFRRLVP